MHGSERLVPHIIADRQREAGQRRLAKLVGSRRSEDKRRVEESRDREWTVERYLPVLRGYPLDPFYANRGR